MKLIHPPIGKSLPWKKGWYSYPSTDGVNHYKGAGCQGEWWRGWKARKAQAEDG